MVTKRDGFFTVDWRYFWGVGIGLVIAWVTSGIAYLKAGDISLPELIIFQIVLSVILLIVGLVIRSREK